MAFVGIAFLPMPTNLKVDGKRPADFLSQLFDHLEMGDTYFHKLF